MVKTEKIIDILAFSKKHGLPIFINYSIYKDLIIDIICYNITNIKLRTLTKNLLLDENNFINNLNNIKLVKNPTNIKSKIVNKNTVKELKNNENSESNENNENNKNNKSTVNNKNTEKFIISKMKLTINEEHPMTHILKYIDNNIYKNFLDFYVSHFVNFNVKMSSILKKLTFKIYTIDGDTFKEKLIKLLESFNVEETRLFNLAISGSTLLGHEYKIVIRNGPIRLPETHTCFQTLEIFICNLTDKYVNFNIEENFEKSEEFIKAKKDFIELLQLIYAEGAHYVH